MKRINAAIVIFWILSGCAPLETARVMGVGVKPFKEQGRIHSYTFDRDLFSCYEEVCRKFGEIGARYYRGSRKHDFAVFTHFNSAFSQCSDSTEVAVFFEYLEPLKTKVEVVSLNYSLADFTAEKIFPGLKDQ